MWGFLWIWGYGRVKGFVGGFVGVSWDLVGSQVLVNRGFYWLPQWVLSDFMVVVASSLCRVILFRFNLVFVFCYVVFCFALCLFWVFFA